MRTIEWRDGIVRTIDQTKLPQKTVWLELRTIDDVADALKTMKIRGAPLIGVAAALALALAAVQSKAKTRAGFISDLENAADVIRKTRPTAVNLFNATNDVLERVKSNRQARVPKLATEALNAALGIVNKDAETCSKIGVYGASLIDPGDTVLTHCNAGALATVEYGTALGVIRAAHSMSKRISVIATETRPLLQGARLTVYELVREHIPVRVIVDSAVGQVMRSGLIDKVVVGADRILRSGHVINKVGTYMIALAAHANNVPFYVAAPTSTLDNRSTVKDVVIEERAQNEVLMFAGKHVPPRGVEALNPAFDITPPELVSAIVTENGIIRPPFKGLTAF